MSPQLPQEIEHLRIDSIIVADRLRHVDEEAVEELRKSIANVGLLTPISVRVVDEYTSADGEVTDGACLLVAGLHRLEAVRGLGWAKVPCVIVKCDDIDARLMEITENLHRANLTKFERDEQVGEWIRLTEEKRAREVSSHGGKKLEGGRPEGGVNAVARELNVPKTSAYRAVEVSKMDEDAKSLVKELGLENRPTVYAEAARAPKGQQADAVRELAERRASKIDSDVKDRAAREVAEMLAEHVPGDWWDALKANLYAAGAANIANALTNLTGQSIMDRRYGA